jgi:hypothetical protein
MIPCTNNNCPLANLMQIIHPVPVDTWTPAFSLGWSALQKALESGEVLYLPGLGFKFEQGEERFLSDRWSDGKAKNINIRPSSDTVRGAAGGASDLAQLRDMLARYARQSEQLVAALFPGFLAHMQRGGTSFRPFGVTQRQTSWRKDDTRLHVDAFPSNPTRGVRLLRVFTTVNPDGQARVWRVGEPFRAFAAKFLPRTRTPPPGWLWLLHALGITKKRRSAYDHLMLQLHDGVKADLNYQRTAPQQEFGFPPGATWVVFSDQVLHAAMSGQMMFEQTFYLDPEGLAHPEKSPLRVLEELTGRELL